MRNLVYLFFKKNILFIFIFLFILIRLIHLPESIGFGSDEGRDFLATRELYVNKQITLIGPPSEFTINGRQFFFGPAPYYVILPALIIGNWDPLFVSYYLILLNCSVFLLALLILNKYIKDKRAIYFLAAFYIFTPVLIKYTQSYWNPHFMLPTSVLLLALLVASKYKKAKSFVIFPVIGLLFGLGMQFHYSFILAIIVSMVWLLIDKKLNIASAFSIFAGFLLGFFPIILFELRNNFYNTNTLLLVLSTSKDFHNAFRLHLFYFISLFPFILFFLSLIISRLTRMNKFLGYALLSVYVLWSLIVIIPVPKSDLNYPTLQKMTKMIGEDKPTNFNIADQLTRDNRATALRYLLSVRGFAPQPVDDYQSIQSLYIYSKEPLDNLLKNPVYEIKSFLPFKKVNTRKIDKDLFMYKLDK